MDDLPLRDENCNLRVNKATTGSQRYHCANQDCDKSYASYNSYNSLLFHCRQFAEHHHKSQALPDSLPPRTRPRLCKATTPSQFLLRYCENSFLGVTRATKVLKEFQTLKHCIYAGFPELRRYLNGSCDNPTTTVSPSKVDKQCFVDMLNSNI